MRILANCAMATFVTVIHFVAKSLGCGIPDFSNRIKWHWRSEHIFFVLLFLAVLRFKPKTFAALMRQQKQSQPRNSSRCYKGELKIKDRKNHQQEKNTR